MVMPIDEKFRKAHRIGQDPQEFNALMRLAVKSGVRSYCEIGARFGGAFYAMVRNLPADGGPYLAVDLPGQKFGVRDSLPRLIRHTHQLNKTHDQVHLIIGDSQLPDIMVKVDTIGPFDLVMIDADHTYEGVAADWENYGLHAQKMCALHDIIGDGRSDPQGNVQAVGRLWAEIKAAGHRTAEIINHKTGKRLGIGVVWL